MEDLIWQRNNKYKKSLAKNRTIEKKLRRLGDIIRERGGIKNCPLDKAMEIYKREEMEDESRNIY